jgi:hypothetical protein
MHFCWAPSVLQEVCQSFRGIARHGGRGYERASLLARLAAAQPLKPS